MASVLGAATVASPAYALGPDEDPIDAFAHLQAQRDDVKDQLESSGAALQTEADGSFAIQGNEGSAAVPTRAASRGAGRLPRMGSSQFDATTGVLTFTWPGIGNVFVTPLDRRTPRSVYTDGSVVSATRVASDLSEVTLASQAYLEQHLVVDEQHAGVKTIVWRYGLELPVGVEAVASNSGVALFHNGTPLMVIAADVAVDEAGSQFPVSTTWDAATAQLTVTWEGALHDPVGAVAIDPVFKDSAVDQLFTMHVCQARGQNVAACEIVPGGALPDRFRPSASRRPMRCGKPIATRRLACTSEQNPA